MKRILAVLLCAGAAMACEGPAGEPGPAGAVTPSTDAFDVGQDETSFDAVAELFVDAPRNPDCDGKECGDDDCGGICGECQGRTVCDAGQCVCAPDCDDKECGDDDCGGTCGECQGGTICDAGQCVCAPDCDGSAYGRNHGRSHDLARSEFALCRSRPGWRWLAPANHWRTAYLVGSNKDGTGSSGNSGTADEPAGAE